MMTRVCSFGMAFKITLERNTLRFAAAHFTTAGGDCERLHGHNYDVFLEVEGDLTADSWVMDFSLVKRRAREVCQELDHRFILQARSTSLAWELRDGEIELGYGDRRYVMPTSDVALLEIDNTTAECLAEWFAARVWEKLQTEGAGNVCRVTVGVEEMPGQAGWFSLDVADHRA